MIFIFKSDLFLLPYLLQLNLYHALTKKNDLDFKHDFQIVANVRDCNEQLGNSD